ncbi:MAG: hypothetical protein N2258_04895 [Brevinematales bacterium]|nr:hypothetical protein [Brevinematales bacterium]
MRNYNAFLFEIYETIFDDSFALEDRQTYLVDNIYTLLEKSLFPVKHSSVKKTIENLYDFIRKEKENGKIFNIFRQVEFIIKELKINDIILFKKIYDCYNDSSLQISPKLYNDIVRILQLLRESDKRLYLIGNNFYTSGIILRFLLKENNIYDLFDGFLFADEYGKVFFDSLSLDYFRKNFCENFLFVTNLRNWHFEKGLGIEILSLANGNDELYNLILSEQ